MNLLQKSTLKNIVAAVCLSALWLTSFNMAHAAVSSEVGSQIQQLQNLLVQLKAQLGNGAVLGENAVDQSYISATKNGNIAKASQLISSSSGLDSSAPITQLFDGDGASGAYGEISEMYFELDLGRAYDLSNAYLFGDNQPGWVSGAWSLQYKQDSNDNYQTAFSDKAAQGNQWYMQAVNKTARYVKVTIHGNGAGGVDAKEFALLGSARGESAVSKENTSAPVNTTQPKPVVTNTNTNTNVTQTTVPGYDISFSTLIDGQQSGIGRDVAFDSSGNVYVTGGVEDFSGITITPGNDYRVNGGNTSHGKFTPHDVFVQKYSPTGTLLWSTRVGGKNYDRAYALEVEGGSVYVAGRAGEGFYTTPGALQENFGGNTAATMNDPYGSQDGFVTKLNANTGKINWSTLFGGDSGEFIRDIDVDNSGNVHIALTFVKSSSGQHVTSDAFQKNLRGSNDSMYAQLSSDGRSLLYGTYIGGDNDRHSTSENPSIFVDAQGDINYLTFTDAQNLYTTPGAIKSGNTQGTDLYVIKWDGSKGGKTIKAATLFGGSADEFMETHNIAADNQGNVIISAGTLSSNVPVTSGVIQSRKSSDSKGDSIITVLSSDFKRIIASTYLGEVGRDTLEGIVYHNGKIYIGGATVSRNFPVTDGSSFSGGSARGDNYLAILSSDLKTIEYASYFGGSDDEEVRSIDVSSNGAIAAIGWTKSNNYPLKNATDSRINGNSAASLTVFKPGQKVVSVPSKTPTTNTVASDEADTVAVDTSESVDSGKQVQTTDNLNVRNSAGLSSAPLGQQRRGNMGTELDAEPVQRDGYNWIRVDFESGADGWVADDFVVRNNESRSEVRSSEESYRSGDRVRTRDNLNVREQPSLNGEVIKVAPNRAAGQVLSNDDVRAGGYNWTKVLFNDGIDGWVAKEYISRD